MRRSLLRAAAAAFAVLLALVLPARAGIPVEYAPMVLQPAGLPERAEFDLTAALERARKAKKRLYVYLGANDCPYCRRYEAFLAKNTGELVTQFARHDYIVVDLRSMLNANARRLHFRIGDKVWDYAAFQRTLGDERERQLVYPSVWLLDANARPLMQMPAGTGTFETVEEQLEILRLEQ